MGVCEAYLLYGEYIYKVFELSVRGVSRKCNMIIIRLGGTQLLEFCISFVH